MRCFPSDSDAQPGSEVTIVAGSKRGQEEEWSAHLGVRGTKGLSGELLRGSPGETWHRVGSDGRNRAEMELGEYLVEKLELSA